MPLIADSASKARFLSIFGGLFPKEAWPPESLEPILSCLQYRELEAGTMILREGQVCSSVPFVLEGSIRVFKTADSGREITLYRIERGQSCILSSACGAGIPSFPASAIAEKPTSAVFMPGGTVRRLFADGEAFRDFVLSQYSRRMAEIMELVEEVAFRRVDERLVQHLVELSSGRPLCVIPITHRELADHVGSSREVVSRILKDWEERGALEISRGSLKLLPPFHKLHA